jgi:hypothetical protein
MCVKLLLLSVVVRGVLLKLQPDWVHGSLVPLCDGGAARGLLKRAILLGHW